MDTRRLFIALAVALAISLIYSMVYRTVVPVPERDQQADLPATQPAFPAVTAPGRETPPLVSKPTTAQVAPPAEFSFTAAPEIEKLSLGGGPDDKLQVDLTSRGAAIEAIKLTGKRKDGSYVHRRDAETSEPYVLIQAVEGAEGPFCSYLTGQIWLGEQAWSLGDLVWEVMEKTSQRVAFTTGLRSAGDSGDRLRVVKTFELPPQSATMQLRLRVENLSDAPFDLRLEQNGPVGITKEHLQYDMRRLVVARWDGEKVDPDAKQRNDLAKKEEKLGSSQGEKRFLWTALGNKYFAVYTRPLPHEGVFADYVQTVIGSVAVPGLVSENPGDLLARIVTMPHEVAPGSATEYVFEIYAGTKNAGDLKEANPAYGDRKQIGYIAAADADARCCCTFHGLTSFMTGLLEMIQVVVRNYGVAIVVLVLIIRVLLHPLTVFQQKSMYRMQEAQARLQPKLNAIKEQYPNDRTKQNQETMKLYSEEGVNPMASMIGMLPLLIQMPILVALWTALNTDVHLRHAGFDPWWITDLSAPDAFIEFGKPITIPILSMLPLVGSWFRNIPSLNLLPILMGVSMWLQQKYMPKPGMQAKLEAAKKQGAEAKPRKASAMSPQDQLRQQQMIAYIMSIMFPLMFYYWPSGLNLYWMSTNVFGILESLRIRKQIEAEKARRQREGAAPPPKKKPGVLSRLFRHMATQAEQLQKKADVLAQEEAKPGAKKARNQRKR